MAGSGINTNWNNDNSDKIDRCDVCGGFREYITVTYKGKKMDHCEKCRIKDKERINKFKVRKKNRGRLKCAKG